MKIKKYAKKSILLSINCSYETIIRSLNKELKVHNCNYIQALILISIFFEKGSSISPSETAQSLSTSKSNISHALAALENHKFIKRALKPSDHRGIEVTLTTKGERMIPKLIKKLIIMKINLRSFVAKVHP